MSKNARLWWRTTYGEWALFDELIQEKQKEQEEEQEEDSLQSYNDHIEN
jgi:hypothetical protein